MGDTYRELLIKKESTASQKAARILIIGLDILLILAGIMISVIFMLAGLVLGVVAYMWLLPRLDVEYEYLYVNGDLDVDAIYSKQKRKKLGSYSVDEMEIAAPSDSHVLDSYKSNGKVKVLDYTSGTGVKSYSLVFSKDKEQVLVMAELEEEMVADLRRRAPRKVNLY